MSSSDLFGGETEGIKPPYKMREPCKKCGCPNGKIETRSGQDCVMCLVCGKHAYNAPKTETGRAVRSTTTVHAAINPNKRYRVLERASGKCELCGKTGGVLHVGHLVSVDAGMRSGMTDAEINDEENLCSLCDECNLGMGATPIPLRLAVAMVMARIKNKME